jgi:DNA-binding transcriptional LysR family regulator
VPLFVRTGRRLELTDAGRLLEPEAERTLAAAHDAADAVRKARTLTGGTASLGTFSTAHHLLLPGLVEDFVRRYPQVAVRVVGEYSVQLVEAVRAGRGRRAAAVTIEQLADAVLVLPEARWGDEDPTRRQLAERAQRAGVAIRPRIEVQHANAALQLAARGVAGTLVTRALLDALGYELATAPLDPPLHETFAFIQRRNARLSPATRALMTLAEQHLCH